MVTENYIPHYPTISNSRKSLWNYSPDATDGHQGRNKRAIQDGDYVAIHNEYNGPMVVFEIFRFEDGK